MRKREKLTESLMGARIQPKTGTTHLCFFSLLARWPIIFASSQPNTRIVSWPGRSHENIERSIRTIPRTQRTAASPPKIPISQAGRKVAAAGRGGPGARRAACDYPTKHSASTLPFSSVVLQTFRLRYFFHGSTV